MKYYGGTVEIDETGTLEIRGKLSIADCTTFGFSGNGLLYFYNGHISRVSNPNIICVCILACYGGEYNTNGISTSTSRSGIYSPTTVLYSRCSQYNGNAFGIFSSNGVVDIENYPNSQGKNNIENNSLFGIAFFGDQYQLDLDQGNNRFAYNLSSGAMAIRADFGTVNSVHLINADNNHWYNGSNAVTPSCGTDYYLTCTYNGQPAYPCLNIINVTGSPWYDCSVPPHEYNGPIFIGGDEGGEEGIDSTAFQMAVYRWMNEIESDSIPLSGVQNLCNELTNAGPQILDTEKGTFDSAYSELKLGVAKLFEAYRKHYIDSATLANALACVFSLQESWIVSSKLQQGDMYWERFRLALDNFVLYRDLGFIQTAINKQVAIGWATPDDQLIPMQWNCWLTRELVIQQHILTKEALDSLEPCEFQYPAGNLAVRPNPSNNNQPKTNNQPQDELKFVSANPEVLTVSILPQEDGKYLIKIYDLNGKEMTEQAGDLQDRAPYQTLIPVSTLASGMYLLEYRHGSRLERRKIVIAK